MHVRRKMAFFRFLPFSCIVLCSIITHPVSMTWPVSMMKVNQQVYFHQVEDGVLLHFYFLLSYFPSLQNSLVELCYTRSLSLHCASCILVNTQEPLSAIKKTTLWPRVDTQSCKEETSPCCFLSVVVANNMFSCLRANVEWVKTWLLSLDSLDALALISILFCAVLLTVVTYDERNVK